MIETAGETGTAPLKRIAQIMVSNVDKKAVDGEVAVRLCNYVDVYKHDAITDELPFMEATASMGQIARFTLHAGDVLITKDSETPDDIAVSAYVPENLPGVVCGYHLAILRPRGQDVDGRYLHWAISSSVVCGQFHASALGITRFGLRQSAIGEIEVPVPPAAKQRSIADYLDRETAQIDALIEKKTRTASLVLDRFRSYLDFVITRAGATRPVRLKHLVHLATSGSRGWGEYYADAGPVFLRIGDLSHDYPFIALEKCAHVTPPPGVEGMRTAVRPGDVLVGITADIGAVGIASASMGVAYVSQHVCLLRPRGDVIPEWLAWALLTSDGQQQLRVMSYGGTKVGLGLGDVRSLLLPCPSTSDQRTIAREVTAEATRVQELRRHSETQVRLLQERRQALITAAVTGQLDIPEAA